MSVLSALCTVVVLSDGTVLRTVGKVLPSISVLSVCFLRAMVVVRVLGLRLGTVTVLGKLCLKVVCLDGIVN